MKPRLVTPLTPEDEDIWHCVGLWPDFALTHVLEYNSTIQDGRDAEFCLALAECREPCRLAKEPKAVAHRWLLGFMGREGLV